VAESTRRPGMVGATCHFARDERGTVPRRDVACQGATRLPDQAPARLRVTRDGELELPHTTPRVTAPPGRSGAGTNLAATAWPDGDWDDLSDTTGRPDRDHWASDVGPSIARRSLALLGIERAGRNW